MAKSSLTGVKVAYDYLVFDLDGTISDRKEGIVHSTNYALAEYGYEPIDAAAVGAYIGPPLDFAFRQITGSDDDAHIQALIARYREQYARSGYSENTLYPGILPLLEKLSRRDVKLAVCTSKRVDFAKSILSLFGIRRYFEFVDGGDVGIPKWQQLQTLLENRRLPKKSVMIGDRNIDLIAAHRNGLASAGVLWGYGSEQELMKESPTHLFQEPGHLIELAT